MPTLISFILQIVAAVVAGVATYWLTKKIPRLTRERRRYVSISTFLLVLVVLWLVARLPNRNFEFQIRVQSVETQVPVANARVTVDIAGQVPLADLTDANGMARMLIDASRINQPGTIWVQAAGYSVYGEKINLQRDMVPKVVSLSRQSPTPADSISHAFQFFITDPHDGATVSTRQSIRGKTPYPHMWNYVVVTPELIGVYWVQPGPIAVSEAGDCAGWATFGEDGIGKGQRFQVALLATDSLLTPGPMSRVPPDAVWSSSIAVTRSR